MLTIYLSIRNTHTNKVSCSSVNYVHGDHSRQRHSSAIPHPPGWGWGRCLGSRGVVRTPWRPSLTVLSCFGGPHPPPCPYTQLHWLNAGLIKCHSTATPEPKRLSGYKHYYLNSLPKIAKPACVSDCPHLGSSANAWANPHTSQQERDLCSWVTRKAGTQETNQAINDPPWNSIPHQYSERTPEFPAFQHRKGTRIDGVWGLKAFLHGLCYFFQS